MTRQCIDCQVEVRRILISEHWQVLRWFWFPWKSCLVPAVADGGYIYDGFRLIFDIEPTSPLLLMGQREDNEEGKRVERLCISPNLRTVSCFSESLGLRRGVWVLIRSAAKKVGSRHQIPNPTQQPIEAQLSSRQQQQGETHNLARAVKT